MNRHVIVILISLVYQMRGSFIDDMAFMILSTPILYPTMIKKGFDPFWLGTIIGITVVMGVVLPPTALTSLL